MDYHTSGLTSRSSAVEQEEPATWIMDSCVYNSPWTVKCFAYVCIVTNNALNRGLMGILGKLCDIYRKNLSPTFYMFRFESRCQFGKPGFPRGQSILQPIHTRALGLYAFLRCYFDIAEVPFLWQISTRTPTVCHRLSTTHIT